MADDDTKRTIFETVAAETIAEVQGDAREIAQAEFGDKGAPGYQRMSGPDYRAYVRQHWHDPAFDPSQAPGPQNPPFRAGLLQAIGPRAFVKLARDAWKEYHAGETSDAPSFAEQALALPPVGASAAVPPPPAPAPVGIPAAASAAPVASPMVPIPPPPSL